MSYCDARGRPDPNGDYELINGKVCLRDGRAARMSARFTDAAAFGDASVNLSDAERAFADSAEGRRAIAFAKMVHDQTRPGLPFTDALKAAATRKALVSKVEHAVQVARYAHHVR